MNHYNGTVVKSHFNIRGNCQHPYTVIGTVQFSSEVKVHNDDLAPSEKVV